MRIVIINGPNINLIGLRETAVYGQVSFDSFLASLQAQFPQHSIDHYQSNVEGELINKLQEVGFSADGIILNAAAYSHTSIALADTIAAIATPVVEVHISNVHAREEFRHKNTIGRVCAGTISGFGLESYTLALVHFLSRAS